MSHKSSREVCKSLCSAFKLALLPFFREIFVHFYFPSIIVLKVMICTQAQQVRPPGPFIDFPVSLFFPHLIRDTVGVCAVGRFIFLPNSTFSRFSELIPCHGM